MPSSESEHPLDALSVRTQALLRALEECEAPDAPRDVAHELLLDGCAHALRLDLTRMRLEQAISRLAAAGEGADARELHRLAGELSSVSGMVEDLREEIARVRERLA